jgi:serine protease AprX
MRPALIGLEHKEGGHSLFEVNMRPATLDATQKLVDVVLHRNVRASDVLEKIAEAAHVSPQLIQIGRNKVRLMVKARRLDDLASVDVVRTVEEVEPRKLLNNIARQILGVPTGGLWVQRSPAKVRLSPSLTPGSIKDRPSIHIRPSQDAF